MDIKKIRWIVGLMSLAMIGLVYFQYFWIDNALRANEDRFKQDVRDAMHQVARRLEKKEVAKATYDNLKTRFLWRRPSGKRGVEFIESTFEKKVLDSGRVFQAHRERPVVEYSMEGQDHFTIELSDSVGGLSFFENMPEPLKGKIEIRAGEQFTAEKSSDSMQIDVIRMEEDMRKVIKKTEMVQVVIQELLTTQRSVLNRFSERELDSLIKQELAAKNIDIPYNFGVLDPRSDKFLLEVQKAPKLGAELKTSDLRAGLFPNDIIGDNSQLVINFPDQQQFLLRKIWLTLSSSALLIVVILFCFGYAIHVILRQKKLSEIKNDFINNMTHEFKTPIATVALACEALQDNDVNQSPGLLNRYLKIIADENKRLGLQVEKVLQMAVIERHDFKLKPVKVNVHEIINKALENEQIQVEKRGGAIAKELNAMCHEIVADELHLTNIVHNLLDNANKYSMDKPKIVISTTDTAKGITINVKDEGIGMGKDQLGRIFERFYRIPTGNLHDVKGFGLGLAYVKRIVDLHGGEISVQSEPKKGTTFSIFFPYAHEQIN